ncbi:MAG TPA: 6-phosphogluconolactonase [Blastocatellia bacterium]|nr:6-phosphogluconolactonase [Blastocatellia bacterium]
MSSNPNVLIFDTPEQVAQAAAERFVDYASASIHEHRSFAVALAGGSTPRRAYELLGTDEFKSRVDWSLVHLFFGDERMVAPDSPESNYRMVNDAFISRVPLPPHNVHPINGETQPQKSAESYETELKSFFGTTDWPRFDLVLLGMGDDGHTASLFPGSDALKEKAKWVVATTHPQSRQARITLTLPVINHAARVNFLVTGEKKAAPLVRVLHGDAANEELPAGKIRPVNGILEWLVDRSAASKL